MAVVVILIMSVIITAVLIGWRVSKKGGKCLTGKHSVSLSEEVTMQDNPSYIMVDEGVTMEPNPCYATNQANSDYEVIKGE